MGQSVISLWQNRNSQIKLFKLLNFSIIENGATFKELFQTFLTISLALRFVGSQMERKLMHVMVQNLNKQELFKGFVSFYTNYFLISGKWGLLLWNQIYWGWSNINWVRCHCSSSSLPDNWREHSDPQRGRCWIHQCACPRICWQWSSWYRSWFSQSKDYLRCITCNWSRSCFLICHHWLS